MLDLAALPPEAPGASTTGVAPPQRAVLHTLVPNSGIQFIDFTMTVESVARTRRRFLEDVSAAGEASLHAAANESGTFYHPLTNEVCDPARTYIVGGVDALASVLGQWLPVPYMRVSAFGEDLHLDEGPSNWARVHITRSPEPPGETYRVVLALDTSIDEATAPSRAYAAPCRSDIEAGAAFRFSDAVDDVAWFVSEAWVDDWLRAACEGGAETGSTASGAVPSCDGGGALKHLARYLTLLGVLREACELPAIRFMPPAAVGAYAETIPVDLALDLGTSRSLALVEERHAVRGDRSPMANS